MRNHGVALYGAIIVSVFVMTLDCFVSWWALTAKISPEMHDIVIFIAGNVNAMALAVVGYWVGSSSGSLIKTTTASGQTEVRTGEHQ